MRMWALRLESQQQREAPTAVESPRQLIHPYIAVSRETGVDAAEVARSIAAKLGWKVLDSELLDYIAEQYGVSRLALDYVDERGASWFHDTFGKWLDEQLVSQAEYVSRLGTVVLLAAQHESTIFVGRGAQFVLPPEAGLSVRLIAPRKQRIQRIAELRQCSQHEAEKFIEESDNGRAEFVRRYFQRDVADPQLYDLVINLERTSRESATELILNHYRLRFRAG
ncbi:MAG: cytidylate kinase-like family protein [Pirellulales bacterium]